MADVEALFGALAASLLGACSLLAPSDAAVIGGGGKAPHAGAAGAAGAASGGGRSGESGSSAGASGGVRPTAGETSAGTAGDTGGAAAGEGSGATAGDDAGGTAGDGSGVAGDRNGAAGGRGGASGTGGEGGDGLGGTAGESATVPSQGLVVWLAADRGIEQVAGAISRWRDQSGNGYDAVATGDGVAPLLVPDALSELPAVELGGDGAGFVLPATLGSFDGLGVYVVLEEATSGTCASLLQLDDPAGAALLDVGREGDAPFYAFGAGSVIGRSATWPSERPFLLSVLHYRNDQASLRVDADFVRSATFARPEGRSFSANRIGVDLTEDCASFRGRLFELLVYDFPTNDEQIAIETYLQAKWGCCTSTAAQ